MSVAAGSPADEAGPLGSDETAQIDGQGAPVGGDITVAIEGEPVQSFDDLTTYLTRNTEVGETVTLTVLRDGAEQTLEVDLSVGDRPQPSVHE